MVECSAVGIIGGSPLSALAFARLVLRDDAPAAFDGLLKEKSLAAPVYGLFGLWFADRARCLRLVGEFREIDEDVPRFCGRITDKAPVREIVDSLTEKSLLDRSHPLDLFRAGCAWSRDPDANGKDAAYWRSRVLDANAPSDTRLRGTRALAYSLDGLGLEALLDLLPMFERELRSDILRLLERIPPWAGGTFEVASRALDNDDTVVQLGALRAAASLTTFPGSRAECQGLVPRVEALLAAFTPREAVDVTNGSGWDGDEADEDWFWSLISALRRIGGPAGPVLVRAEQGIRSESCARP
jgi:hypothetical protein